MRVMYVARAFCDVILTVVRSYLC